MDQFSKNEKVEQLKRQLMDLQSENDRLSHQVQTMVGNYQHQIDSKDEAIRALRERIADATTSCKDASEVEQMYRRENDALKKENHLFREKNDHLMRDLDRASRDKSASSQPLIETLENENRRLRADMQEKERDYQRLDV